MQIAAMYIRVSTEEQTELSPDSQIKQIREYAKTHDYIVPDEFIFRDDGISGRKTKNRPGFTAMIGTAKRKPKPFDVILVWKFSRFARNREDSIVYKSMLKKQGIDVISISEPLSDDKMSVLFEAMIEAMDEYYSLNLSEEVSRGMLEKLSRGQCVNSAPIGYRFKDGELVVDEEKADIVRRIYAEYLSGTPMLTIARGLTNDGISTLYGNPWENRTIEYILRNPLYCGKLRFTPGGGGSSSHYHSDKEVMIVPGTHEPIIDPEQWEQVQKKISEHKAKYRRYSRDTALKHEYMLRGLLKCSTCGGSLTYASADSVQCIKYMHGKCSVSHHATLRRLNDAVIAAVRAADFSSDFLFEPRADRPRAEHGDAEKQLHRERIKLERIKEAYAAGIDTIEEYREQKTKITAEIQRLEAQLNDRQPVENTSAVLSAHRVDFLRLLEDPQASQTALNQALKAFIARVVYDKSSESITIFYCG